MEKYQLMERVRRVMHMLAHMRGISLINEWIQKALEEGNAEAQTGLAHHVFGAVTVSIPEVLHEKLDWEEERQVVIAAVVAIAAEYQVHPDETKFALDGDMDSGNALEDRVTDRIWEQMQRTARTFMANDGTCQGAVNPENNDLDSRARDCGYGSNA